MGYGSPMSGSATAVYTVAMTHTNGEQFRFTSLGYGGMSTPPTESERDSTFLEMVDYLNAHADLTVDPGSKTYQVVEQINPTT